MSDNQRPTALLRFWVTIIQGVLIFFCFILTQYTVAFLFHAFAGTQQNMQQYSSELGSNGLFIAVATIFSAVTCTALIFFMVYAQQRQKVLAYLQLFPIGFGALQRWLWVTVFVAITLDVIAWLLGQSLVPDFMKQVYETAGFLPLLLLAFVIAGPVFEEIFFRGFLLEGMLPALGASGAMVITALLWAVIHMQYDFFGTVSIFALGILFAYARLRSGSIFVPIAMHGLVNLLALIETAAVVQTGSSVSL